MKTSLVVPAYNEEKALIPVIEEALPYVDEIIIGLGAKGTASAASGTGQMLIDDIRLYRP